MLQIKVNDEINDKNMHCTVSPFLLELRGLVDRGGDSEIWGGGLRVG